MGYRVAVVGATGNVGREMLQILAERNFPADDVIALASARSVGLKTSFGDKSILKVQDLAKFDFKGVDIVLSSPGAKVSAEHSPRAAKAGAVVIAGYKRRGIIANPNCSTIQMVVALKPLHDAATIKRIVVSTYQSTSGAGKEAMDELLNQTKSFFVNQDLEPKKFSKNIAFNVIPQIDVFMEDGSTKEEWKMMVETKKILDPKIKVHATCVRVPTFVGHAEAINLELERPLDDVEARRILSNAPGVLVVDQREPGGYITPKESTGQDGVFVSRIRVDPTIENGLSLWVVSDNLRKGAALNTCQIAEELIKGYI